jgi:DNA oxidative demethylase
MAMRGVQERPPGLRYSNGIVTVEEEAHLRAWLTTLDLEPVVMHGVASRRQVRHFGVGYHYQAWTTSPTDAIPAELLELRARTASIAGVEPATFVEALVTRYPTGASIGWHRDATSFGPVVAGVSLCADTVMRFQRRAKGGERRVFEQPLAQRSVYVLSGSARAAWQHSVPPVRQERWSVTLRQLRQD